MTDLYISGYASVFGERDLIGDRVQRGAFAASLLSATQKLPMLSGHKTDQPIGVWDRVVEDARGLFVAGRLLSGSPLADSTAKLIREGAMTGLSIGYRTRRHQPTARGRTLTELDLWEVSVVAFPMQRTARITTIGDTPLTLSPPPNQTPKRIPA